jgi:hypothetical protein
MDTDKSKLANRGSAEAQKGLRFISSVFPLFRASAILPWRLSPFESLR